jgi:pimeloyl-ACP methyl ester carboxylesterase
METLIKESILINKYHLSSFMKIYRLMILAFFILNLGACAWLDVKQREVIYRPTLGMASDVPSLRRGDERFFAEVPRSGGQRIELWWLPHADKTVPTLLYLHGTFRTLFENQHKIDALRAAGFSVLAVDYRGWGLSTPITPSEQTILQDADVAWAELQRRETRPGQRLIYGHSMGSAVAVDLASRLQAKQDYGALILESAFSSFSDLANESGFLARLLMVFSHERFASIEKIAKVNAPLLMIHGTQDTTIPIHLSEKLFSAAKPPKQWIAMEGGAHSDLHEVGGDSYQNALRNFVRQLLPAP